MLSDAVTAMRAGRSHAARTVLRRPWGVSFAPQRGAGFHVILQGATWLLPQGGEPIALGVGDVAFMPRELGHALADDPSRPPAGAVPPLRDDPARPTGPVTELLCGAYQLDHSRPHPLLAELPEVVHIPARVGRHPSLRGAIDLLALEVDSTPGPGADAARPALLDVLLLYILRAWYAEQPGDAATGWGAALRDPVIAAALRGIHQEPERPWTVQSLAASAGLSRAAFAQRFTAKVGSPPLTYLTWWRMTLAARLLRDTDLPLRAVAGRTGYATEFALAKAFKREFGTAPGRYRVTA